MTAIAAGDKAPPFTAQTQTGEEISLADFLGKQVVVCRSLMVRSAFDHRSGLRTNRSSAS